MMKHDVLYKQLQTVYWPFSTVHIQKPLSQRDVTQEEAQKFADENGIIFMEASAKTFVQYIADVWSW